MIPFAISNAIAVKVGYSNGAKNYSELKKYAITGTLMSEIFMTFSAIIFLLFPKFIVGIFTSDINLFKISLPIMNILVIFQIFDGLQISLSGICKGIKETKIVFWANLIAYWGVSIPLGYILAFKANLMLTGFWCGLLAASVVLCAVMLFRLYKIFSNYKILE